VSDESWEAESKRLWNEAMRSRVYHGPIVNRVVWVSVFWACFLALVGRAWPLDLLLAAVVATCLVFFVARVPDLWQVPWLSLAWTVNRASRRQLVDALGVEPPRSLSSAWLEGRPAGSVPDGVWASVLTQEGELARARAVIERMPTDTPLDRYRRAMAVASLDLREGRPALYAVARREAAGLDDERRRRAMRAIAHNEYVAAIHHRVPVRSLTPPKSGDIRLDLPGRLAIWGWFCWPALLFLGPFAFVYSLLLLAGFLVGR
jgi:hypothetical protein